MQYLQGDDCKLYMDIVKTLITASGIGVAVIASGFRNGQSSWELRAAVFSLLACIALSVLLLLALVRVLAWAVQTDGHMNLWVFSTLQLLVFGSVLSFLLGVSFLACFVNQS